MSMDRVMMPIVVRLGKRFPLIFLNALSKKYRRKNIMPLPFTSPPVSPSTVFLQGWE